MGRTMKRVPLDFDYPLNKVWYGYYNQSINYCHDNYSAGCEGCKKYAEIKEVPFTDYGCPDYDKYYGVDMSAKVEPPKGDGFQLWETTTEGSPTSPVFNTLEKLCEWCAENATTFASFTATKEEWMQMLDEDFVHVKQGNAIFI